MKIEVLLTEAEIAQEFSEAMEARDLPEKFFYWFPPSVQAWLAVARDPLFEGLNGSWGAMAGKLNGLLEHFGPVPVVSFGAGDGSRDRLLLEALQKAGRDVRYFPVDASQSLLEAACSAAEDADVDTLGIKADISSPMHLVLASDAAESPKLFVMAGNIIGAFDPLDQIRHVAQAMHEGDRLILDAEMYQEDTMARRSTEVLQDFAFAPLASIGVTHEDGAVKFDHRRDERHDGLHLIARSFRADRDLRATVSGSDVMFQRGERLSMNFQYVYSPEAFRWLIEKHAGLDIVDACASADGKFLVAACSK